MVCDRCGSLADKGMKFGVAPYFHAGGKRRLMLIGQDPTHRLFATMLSGDLPISPHMKEAFTGHFIRANYNGIEFDYSPCLHIKTFGVTEKYGESVQRFKENMSSYFAEN